MNTEESNLKNNHVMEKHHMSHCSLISVDVVPDRKQKITRDIQAAGQTANRVYSAYQYTALSDNPEDTHTCTLKGVT